ncbi:MAG: DinB family protein [Cyclobacteriaceae bacterium]
MKPPIDEIPAFYRPYIDTLSDGDLIDTLKQSKNELVRLISDLNEAQGGSRYAEDKWTIKEVMVHLLDSERVFAYRALRFARNDQTDLPGFEQNDYVPNSEANRQKLGTILDHFIRLRASNVDLFESFSSQQLERTGTANGFPVSVRAIGYIIAGHQTHHLNIMKERYLS